MITYSSPKQKYTDRPPSYSARRSTANGRIMELPRENTDMRMSSPPPAERRHTFGVPPPLANRSDFQEHERDSGTHALRSTGTENDL